MGYTDVRPGVGIRHLEGPKSLDGLNLGIYVFVYVYKEHMIDWCCFYYFVKNSLVALLEALCAWCIYMLGSRMRFWTNCFFAVTYVLFPIRTVVDLNIIPISQIQKRIWAHRPSIKGTKLLFIAIKAIIIIIVAAMCMRCKITICTPCINIYRTVDHVCTVLTTSQRCLNTGTQFYILFWIKTQSTQMMMTGCIKLDSLVLLIDDLCISDSVSIRVLRFLTFTSFALLFRKENMIKNKSSSFRSHPAFQHTRKHMYFVQIYNYIYDEI